MCLRQEGVEPALADVERGRVRARLRRDGLDSAHAADVHDINHAGLADGDVTAGARSIEKDHVGRPGERDDAKHSAGCGVEGQKLPVVTRAEEPAGLAVQIEAVRAYGGHVVRGLDPAGIVGGDCNDLRRVGDVHEEAIELPGIDGPARATRHGDRRAHRPRCDIDHRQGTRARHGWIADVRRQERSAHRIDRQSIGPDTDGDLHDDVLRARLEDADRVLAAVRRERTTELVRDQDTGHGAESVDGADEALPLAVDHVHRVVHRVGNVKAAGPLVTCRMVEAPRPAVRREVDVALEAERHGYPRVFRWQYAYSASYIGNSHSSFRWSSAVTVANPRAIASRPSPSGIL